MRKFGCLRRVRRRKKRRKIGKKEGRKERKGSETFSQYIGEFESAMRLTEKGGERLRSRDRCAMFFKMQRTVTRDATPMVPSTLLHLLLLLLMLLAAMEEGKEEEEEVVE